MTGSSKENKETFDYTADCIGKNYIKLRKQNEEDEWPPNSPRTIVNVAIKHSRGNQTEQVLRTSSKRQKIGTPAFDKVAATNSKVTRNVKEIFLVDSAQSEPPVLILIEGAPGIGKTVLSKEIAYLWAKKELLQNIELLVLLFLRDPDLQKVTDIKQLVQYILSINHCRLNAKQVDAFIGQLNEIKICVVLDGYDEYPVELHRGSIIAKIIKRNVFPDAIVVLSSRPTATAHLHDTVDQLVEIIGFAQEERNDYISRSLKSPKKVQQLKDYLSTHPTVNGLMYVPLHLAILIYLFNVQDKLPKTITEMNYLFILHTAFRHAEKYGLVTPEKVTKVEKLEDLPEVVYNVINKLSRLAYGGLSKRQLIFTHQEIKSVCSEIDSVSGAFNGFGLLQAVQHFAKTGAGNDASLNFLHFTMQEFLAALYVTGLPQDEQASLMSKNFWKKAYNHMWMMYVGINGASSQIFMRFLGNTQSTADASELDLPKDIKNNKFRCLHLLQCFMEARSDKIPKDVSSIFNNGKIDFHGNRLDPHHIASVLMYISKNSIKIKILNLQNCCIGDIGMGLMEQYFISNPDSVSCIEHANLLGNNSLLLKNMYSIFMSHNMTTIYWSSLKAIDIKEIVNVLKFCTQIQNLNLSYNHFGDDAFQQIAGVLHKLVSLETLVLSGNNNSIAGAKATSGCIKYSALKFFAISFKDLFLVTTPEIDLSERLKCLKDCYRTSGVKIVAEVLHSNRTVENINLSNNRISYKEANFLSECIENNCTLKEIDISYNKISNDGVKSIVTALKYNCTLTKLNVANNKISTLAAPAISESLKVNNTIKELNLSYNCIENGFTKITESIQENKALTVLDISHNNISCEGMLAVQKFLMVNSTLVDLNMSHNTIGDAIYISASLQKLNISHCKISNIGASRIRDCLLENNELHKLDVSHNKISYHGGVNIFNGLKMNKKLQQLDISKNPIPVGAIKGIISDYLKGNCTLYKLKISFGNTNTALKLEVEIGKTYVCIPKGDNGAILLAALAQNHYIVKKLYLPRNDLSDAAAGALSDYLANDKMLQVLDISENDITSIGACKIAKALRVNTSLQQLCLSHNKISNDGAIALCECLKRGTVQMEPANESLEALDISYNEISNEGAISISTSLRYTSVLKKLNISNNNICDAGIVEISKAIGGNKVLQLLDISHNSISPKAVKVVSMHLKSNTDLQQFSISIGGVHLYFRTDPSFHCRLRDNQCYGNATAILASAFLHHSNVVQTLNLSLFEITDDGVNAISEYLTEATQIQQISLPGNKLAADGMKRLVKAITNSTICKLIIPDNIISDDGARFISKYLEGNSSLQELDVSKNKIGDDGAIHIIKAIHNNTALQVVQMSHNIITDEGMIGISECLKHNRSLQQLNVSHNKFGEKTLLDIAEALQQNAMLLNLDISGIVMSDSDLTSFSYHLKDNYSLQELAISKLNTSGQKVDLKLSSINLKIPNQQVHDIAAVLISSFLFKPARLQQLCSVDISQNSISDDGAMALSEYLKTFDILESLDISKNEVTNTGAIVLMKNIPNSLKYFDITYNSITKSGLQMIFEMYIPLQETLTFVTGSWKTYLLGTSTLWYKNHHIS